MKNSFIGFEMTGRLACGELCSGQVLSCPSPRIRDGEDDIDNKVDSQQYL